MQIKGQIETKPERRSDGRWHFLIWDSRDGRKIECLSSKVFDTENQGASLDLKPHDHIALSGKIENGQCWFDNAVKGVAKEQAT